MPSKQPNSSMYSINVFDTRPRCCKSSFDKNSPFLRASTICFATFVPRPGIALNGGMSVFPSIITSLACERYKSTYCMLMPRSLISSAISRTVIKFFSFGDASNPFIAISSIRLRIIADPCVIAIKSKSSARTVKYAA